MSLTVNQIRCLLSILALTRMQEEVASKNVAKLLGVSKPSVHKALDILVAKGLVEKQPYGSAKLTEIGMETALNLEEHQERLLLMFSRKFGLPLDESNLAATLLLGELKEESLELLEKA